MDTNKAIGKRIKERRKELELTQEQVGKIIGVTKSTIQRYENGLIKDLKMPVIQAIANALRVNPDWIVLKSDVKELLINKLNNDKKNISDKEFKLLESFNKLNNIGKNEAQKRVEELTLIDTYNKSTNMLRAAARNGNITELPDSPLIDEDIENAEDPDFL